jgi:hypothetical protein
VVLVISGGNIDVHLLDRIIEKGLAQTGRIVRFGVILRDIPGALAELTSLVAQLDANILTSSTKGLPKIFPSDSLRCYWCWKPGVGITSVRLRTGWRKRVILYNCEFVRQGIYSSEMTSLRFL